MSSETEKPTKRRRRVRIWHVLVAIVVVLIVAVCVLRWHWKREFRQRIEAIAAAGYPVTLEELDASYERPAPGENAADWVIGAGSYLVRPSGEEWQQLDQIVGWGGLPGTRGPLTPDVERLLAQHLEANAKALDLLHQAATMSESYYPIDRSKGPASYVVPIHDVRESCLLLCLEAVQCAEVGHSEGAVRAFEAAFHVAGTFRWEPVLTPQVFRMGAMRSTLGVLQRILSQIDLTDAELARLAQAFSGAFSPAAMPRFLAGHRCAYLDLFRRPQTVDHAYFLTAPRPTSTLLELYNATGLAARDGTVFLDMMKAFLTVTELPFHQCHEAVARISKRFLERCEDGLLAEHVLSIGPGLEMEVQSLACLRCGQVALVIERYRRTGKDYPEALRDLVPEYLEKVPKDPYTGRALHYRRLDRGFVVYSVGEDGVDDGGREAPPDGREPGQTCDITFTVER
jgi:hypothetical protein